MGGSFRCCILPAIRGVQSFAFSPDGSRIAGSAASVYRYGILLQALRYSPYFKAIRIVFVQ